MLLAGTLDGAYRVPLQPFETAEQVLATPIRQLHADDGVVLAATESGLYPTADDGETWTALDGPAEGVHAVYRTDEAIYAGGRPAALYRSSDGGGTWEQAWGIRSLAAAGGGTDGSTDR